MRRLLISIAVVASFAAAQTSTGTLQVTVSDAQGATLRGFVRIVNAAKQFEVEHETDATGRLIVTDLPAGRYALTARAPGFAPSNKVAVVAAGQRGEVKLVLAPATVVE